MAAGQIRSGAPGGGITWSAADADAEAEGTEKRERMEEPHLHPLAPRCGCESEGGMEWLSFSRLGSALWSRRPRPNPREKTRRLSLWLSHRLGWSGVAHDPSGSVTGHRETHCDGPPSAPVGGQFSHSSIHRAMMHDQRRGGRWMPDVGGPNAQTDGRRIGGGWETEEQTTLRCGWTVLLAKPPGASAMASHG